MGCSNSKASDVSEKEKTIMLGKEKHDEDDTTRKEMEEEGSSKAKKGQEEAGPKGEQAKKKEETTKGKAKSGALATASDGQTKRALHADNGRAKKMENIVSLAESAIEMAEVGLEFGHEHEVSGPGEEADDGEGGQGGPLGSKIRSLKSQAMEFVGSVAGFVEAVPIIGLIGKLVKSIAGKVDNVRVNKYRAHALGNRVVEHCLQLEELVAIRVEWARKKTVTASKITRSFDRSLKKLKALLDNVDAFLAKFMNRGYLKALLNIGSDQEAFMLYDQKLSLLVDQLFQAVGIAHLQLAVGQYEDELMEDAVEYIRGFDGGLEKLISDPKGASNLAVLLQIDTADANNDSVSMADELVSELAHFKNDMKTALENQAEIKAGIVDLRGGQDEGFHALISHPVMRLCWRKYFTGSTQAVLCPAFRLALMQFLCEYFSLNAEEGEMLVTEHLMDALKEPSSSAADDHHVTVYKVARVFNRNVSQENLLDIVVRLVAETASSPLGYACSVPSLSRHDEHSAFVVCPYLSAFGLCFTEFMARLEDRPLLLVEGPVGVGKTYLLKAFFSGSPYAGSEQSLCSYTPSCSVVYVDVHQLATLEDVAAALTRALHLFVADHSAEHAVLSWLQGRVTPLLLVFDGNLPLLASRQRDYRLQQTVLSSSAGMTEEEEEEDEEEDVGRANESPLISWATFLLFCSRLQGACSGLRILYAGCCLDEEGDCKPTTDAPPAAVLGGGVLPLLRFQVRGLTADQVVGMVDALVPDWWPEDDGSARKPITASLLALTPLHTMLTVTRLCRLSQADFAATIAGSGKVKRQLLGRSASSRALLQSCPFLSTLLLLLPPWIRRGAQALCVFPGTFDRKAGETVMHKAFEYWQRAATEEGGAVPKGEMTIHANGSNGSNLRGAGDDVFDRLLTDGLLVEKAGVEVGRFYLEPQARMDLLLALDTRQHAPTSTSSSNVGPTTKDERRRSEEGREGLGMTVERTAFFGLRTAFAVHYLNELAAMAWRFQSRHALVALFEFDTEKHNFQTLFDWLVAAPSAAHTVTRVDTGVSTQGPLYRVGGLVLDDVFQLHHVMTVMYISGGLLEKRLAADTLYQLYVQLAECADAFQPDCVALCSHSAAFDTTLWAKRKLQWQRHFCRRQRRLVAAMPMAGKDDVVQGLLEREVELMTAMRAYGLGRMHGGRMSVEERDAITGEDSYCDDSDASGYCTTPSASLPGTTSHSRVGSFGRRGSRGTSQDLEAEDKLLADAALLLQEGLVAQHNKLYAEALTCLEACLLLRQEAIYGKESGGLDHPPHALLSSVHSQIAFVYCRLLQFPAALEHYGRCLAMEEQLLGPHHPHCADTLSNMANAMAKQGTDFPAALQLCHRALSSYELSGMGNHHASTVACRADMALVCEKLFLWEEAAAVHAVVLSARQLALGDTHNKTISVRYALARCQDKASCAARAAFQATDGVAVGMRAAVGAQMTADARQNYQAVLAMLQTDPSKEAQVADIKRRLAALPPLL